MANKLIETPDRMWGLFVSYINKIKATPFKVKDWVGKEGLPVFREKEKPLTMVGFEGYVFDQGLNGSLHRYFANTEGAYSDYIDVCERIRNAIRADQIEGGMAGIYNPSITQRLNNLVEQTETKLDANLTFTFDLGHK